MNKYILHVGNAEIPCRGVNEYSAMLDLCLFLVGDMIAYCPVDGRDAWCYRVEVMGKIQVAFIERDPQ